MQPTTEILERISKDSLTHKEEVFTRLYRYLLRPDIYYQAYQRLYTNKGASTKGINQDTADGFSEAKIEKIIQSLADETYQPTPVRRTYIAKKSNPKKKRPLGIPTFTDKLVQEALRMILEAIYEPLFLDCSHGFRPKRSCHTALDKLKYQFGGVRWFVEGDIKGCFDNINHDALVGFIGSKVKDARIVKLVWNRVTINRAAHKSTRYYIDEMHLLLKEEQTAAYTVEIWKRFRKWGGIPTGITQNVKDLLSSREVENIFENSDFVYMLNQAGGDRQILAKQLGISTHQLSYVTHSGEGEGLLFYGSTILPFVDHFPKSTELYRIMTTKPQELKKKEDE